LLWLLIAAARRLAGALATARGGPTRAALFAGLAAVVAHLVHGFTHFTVGSSWIQIGFYIGLGLGVGELMRARASSAMSFDSNGAVRAAFVAASTIVAAPVLSEHPALAGCSALAALLDCGARFAVGRHDDLDLALAASMAFVAVSTFVLLVLAPQTNALGVRVLVAAAAPFALVQAMRRAFDLADVLRAARQLKAARNRC
jgi:hypothetical protein